MELEVRARLKWIRLYEETHDAGLVCRKCGISRPTLRKWLRRYQESGLEGLKSQSRRPKTSPATKVTDQYKQWILELRGKRKLGARRIQSELNRHYECSLSLATIHKVLKKHNVGAIVRPKRKKRYKRYQKDLPGERIQMDTMKIAPGFYQYTAIDDCSRYKVIGIYPRKSAKYTLLFLEKVLEEMPFSIQSIQTDRGKEFFAYKVQEMLRSYGIKFRPIKPASPHLNGKVERAQKTDLDEFYATIDIHSEDLEELMYEWQHYYNWERVHSSIGKPPIDKVCELFHDSPLWEDVQDAYVSEPLQEQNYWLAMRLKNLEKVK